MASSDSSSVWKSCTASLVLCAYSDPLQATLMIIMNPYHSFPTRFSSSVEWYGCPNIVLNPKNPPTINILSFFQRLFCLSSPNQALNNTYVPANYSGRRSWVGTLMSTILIQGISYDSSTFSFFATLVDRRGIDPALINWTSQTIVLRWILTSLSPWNLQPDIPPIVRVMAGSVMILGPWLMYTLLQTMPILRLLPGASFDIYLMPFHVRRSCNRIIW